MNVAFLSVQQRSDGGTGKCSSEVSSVVRLGLHGDVNVRGITLQERGFQEKHRSAMLYP